ncbi:hypothetical protein ACK8HH_17225 [Gordonia sp. LUNF6]|uniref:hypothetical protein n=1 Tax=Gordonia sp. LUNF6 TaxID=3388658 RepID=UPI00399A6D5B
MRITPNSPAICMHEELDTDIVEVRSAGVLRVDVSIVCRDCETLLQRETHTIPIGDTA